MKYLFLIGCVVIAILSYIAEYKKCLRVVGNSKKVLKNFLAGLIGNLVIAIPWYFLMPYKSFLKSAQSVGVGLSVVWILSIIWERFIDGSPDVIDTYNRLLGAIVPVLLLIFMLFFV